MRKFFNKLTPQNLFFIVSITGILLFIIVAPIVRINIMDWISMENNSYWTFTDYYRHLYYSIDRNACYGSANDTVFSPLAYVIYHLIYRTVSDSSTTVEYYQQMITMPYQSIIFMMYSLIGVFGIMFDIELLRLPALKRWMLTFCVIFSVPFFMGGLERGNLTVHCVAILAMALLLKDSENKKLREVALLLIAFGAALKIYVAAAGLLYLAEKRWKEAKRLVIYGMIMFFLPFVLIGGFDGFVDYYITITAYNGYAFGDRIEYIQGLLNYFGVFGNVEKTLSFLFVAILLAAFFASKDTFRKNIFFVSLLVFIPGNAYRYSLLYFLVPLFILMTKEVDKNWISFVNAFLFGCIFTIPTILGLFTGFRLAYGEYALTCVEVFVYTPAWLLLAFNLVVEINTLFIKPLQNRKTYKSPVC